MSECFILHGGFCHAEPPGELYFLVLCLFIPGGICHAEPPEYGHQSSTCMNCKCQRIKLM